MGCLVSILVPILIVIVLALFVNYPIQASFIAVILITLGIVAYYTDKAKKEEQLKLQNESKERALQVYNDIKANITIPENALKVKYKGGHAKLLKTENYMWVDNNILCFFPATPPDNDSPSNIEKIILFKIPINKLEYYATRGEVVYENKITGGGGGGSSIGGAVVGGVIAGGTGAVVGSRKKIDPIKSELVTHDTRETFLNFFDDENKKHSLFFDFDDYRKFSELLPEKAFEIVNIIKTKSILNKAINEDSAVTITDQIRELAKLKDEGLLTDEEFSEKKKALLEKIG